MRSPGFNILVTFHAAWETHQHLSAPSKMNLAKLRVGFYDHFLESSRRQPQYFKSCDTQYFANTFFAFHFPQEDKRRHSPEEQGKLYTQGHSGPKPKRKLRTPTNKDSLKDLKYLYARYSGLIFTTGRIRNPTWLLPRFIHGTLPASTIVPCV